MARQRNPLNGFVPVVLAALALASCGLDGRFESLGDKLLAPDIQTFDAPGVQLLKGAHSALSVHTTNDSEVFVLGLTEDNSLSIHNLVSGSECAVPGVLQYPADPQFDPLQLSGEPSLIRVIREIEPGRAALQFVTFGCALQELTIPGATLSYTRQSDPGNNGSLLVLRESEVLQVNPWTSESRVVATDVRGGIARPLGLYQWVEAGRLVFRDEQLNEVATIGTDVREAVMSLSRQQLAFVDGGAPSPAGGPLYTVNPLETEPPTQIETDACGLRYLNSSLGVRLSYFSPCAERRLVLFNPGDTSKRIISSGVLAFSQLGVSDDQLSLSYITEPTPERESTLWVVEGNAEAQSLGTSPGTLAAQQPDGSLLAIVDTQLGVGGTLVRRVADTNTPVAEGISELGSMGTLETGELTFLANANGPIGDVYSLDNNGDTRLLSRGFLRGSLRDGGYLGDFADDVGTLYHLDRLTGSSAVVTDNVAPGGFRATQQWPGWMVLRRLESDAAGGTLSLLLEDSGNHIDIARGVVQVSEVATPGRGVIYTVDEGPAAGVWFSKAR